MPTRLQSCPQSLIPTSDRSAGKSRRVRRALALLAVSLCLGGTLWSLSAPALAQTALERERRLREDAQREADRRREETFKYNERIRQRAKDAGRARAIERDSMRNQLQENQRRLLERR